jgi:hypothetical protein
MSKSSTLPFIFVGVLVGVLLCAGLVALGVFLRGSEYAARDSTPILSVLQAPTITASATSEPLAEQTQEAATPTFVPAQGGVQVGALVEIIGTEGEGLRFRSEPGLDSRILFLAVENEVFEVLEGRLCLVESRQSI